MSHDPVSLPNSSAYDFTSGMTFGTNAMAILEVVKWGCMQEM